MRGFYKTKRFIALVAIALSLVIIPATLSAMGLGGTVKNAVTTVLLPIEKLMNKIATSLGGFSAYLSEFDRINEENEALKKELSELKSKLSKDDKLERDYEWLADFIELKREHTDFSLIDTAVTGRESGNLTTVLTVDKGTKHGIKEGMPVITADGIVGSVVEVGKTWAKVETILNVSVKLGGMVERSGDTGLISSDFVMTKEGTCKMTYLPTSSDIREGDRILTSGYGSVYPRSLVIGSVTKVVSDPLTQTLTAYIEPAVDFSKLDRLMIVTDYEVYVSEADDG